MARTTAWTDERGNNAWANTGAVGQHDGSLKIMVCNTCGDQVVWATSKKTGRYYLVNIRSSYHGGRFYMGHDVHKCDEVMARRAALQQAQADDRAAAR
jgi:hypothetical protein